MFKARTDIASPAQCDEDNPTLQALSPPPAPESVSGGVPPPPPPIHDGMWDFEKKLARPSTRAERLAEKAATTTAGEEWEGESSVFALEERPMARESSKPPMEVLR